VFCVSVKVKLCFFIVKVKLTVPLQCVYVHFAWKGLPRNDLYCVGWDIKLTLCNELLAIDNV